MSNAPIKGYCLRCKAYVNDLGGAIGVWNGGMNRGGTVYETRCFRCQAILRAFHNSCDERWIDDELTPSDLEWEIVDEKKPVT